MTALIVPSTMPWTALRVPSMETILTSLPGVLPAPLNAVTAPRAISSFSAYTAVMSGLLWISCSITCWPLSRAKSPVCCATISMPGAPALSWLTKPLVRSVVTLLPEEPSRMATFPLPSVALISASAARLPCSTKFETGGVQRSHDEELRPLGQHVLDIADLLGQLRLGVGREQLLDADLRRFVLDGLGLGDPERVGFLLRLGEAHDGVFEVELRGAVALQRAATAGARAGRDDLLLAGAAAAGWRPAALALGTRGEQHGRADEQRGHGTRRPSVRCDHGSYSLQREHGSAGLPAGRGDVRWYVAPSAARDVGGVVRWHRCR